MTSRDNGAVFYRGPRTIEPGTAEADNPGPGELQVQVAFNGICGTDLHIYHGDMDNRVTLPAIIGHEMSGIVTAVGPGVEGWTEGDHTTVMPLDSCGECPACKRGHQHICHNLNFVGIDSPGALQQLWNIQADWAIPLPQELPLDVAALTEPLAVAVHDVRRSGLTATDTVVVIGGGPIGMLIALVAQQEGAQVLVSEPDPGRRSIAAEMGLDTVDPRSADLEAIVNERTGDTGADVAFEVSGTQPGLDSLLGTLRVRGVAVIVAIHTEPRPVDLFRIFWRELTVHGARVYEHDDFTRAVDLLHRKAIPAARLISHVIPAGSAGDAFAILDKPGPVMKVLIDCQDFS